MRLWLEIFLSNKPLVPFSKRLKKAKLDSQFTKFLNIINLPFVEVLAQIPNYVKFMKEIMSNKRKLNVYGIVSLSNNCNAIIQKKLLEKMKDLRSFTIPYTIRGYTFEKALYDLRASINLMLLSIAKKLNSGELTPIFLLLQIADISLTHPEGIIKNDLVKVDKFIFPMDFVMLDMEEDKETPLPLGRPFLTT